MFLALMLALAASTAANHRSLVIMGRMRFPHWRYLDSNRAASLLPRFPGAGALFCCGSGCAQVGGTAVHR